MSDLRDAHVGFIATVVAPELTVVAVTAAIAGLLGQLVVELGSHWFEPPPDAQAVVRRWTLAGAVLGLLLLIARVA